MGKLTDEVFNPSCCDGGGYIGSYSCQPCGCDPGAGWVCKVHRQVISKAEFDAIAGIYPMPILATETRITDPLTGGEKGSKLARFDLVPAEATWALAEHYGKGCAKYADRNWELGYKWGLSVAALERHLNLWKQGESYDAETGSHHLIAVAWHAFALFIFELRSIGTDDVRVKHEY